ncbi:MAG: Asp-tRNA(Asn)/Glu-tRNA(Gln) amidotransferase GatCAB subunit B, partial [Pseudomonadota bacterium]
FLTSSRDLADYFEDCVTVFPDPKQVSNWVMGALPAMLNARGISLHRSPVSAQNLGRLLKLINNGVISGKIAKTVFEEMAQTGRPPEDIVEERQLVQVTDETEIRTVIRRVLEGCAAEVADYKNGKTKLFGFFVGQVMKETRGKANPKIVNEILTNMIDS